MNELAHPLKLMEEKQKNKLYKLVFRRNNNKENKINNKE